MKPTRPVVPIELDRPRTLKLNMAAVALWTPEGECGRLTGSRFVQAVVRMERYVNTLAEFAKRVNEPLTETDSIQLEPPANIITGLLYCLLQHEWLEGKAEPLTFVQVGNLIDFECLAEIASLILQAIAGNLAVPPSSQVASAQSEGANGQDPLLTPGTTTGTLSPLSPATISA